MALLLCTKVGVGTVEPPCFLLHQLQRKPVVLAEDSPSPVLTAAADLSCCCLMLPRWPLGSGGLPHLCNDVKRTVRGVPPSLAPGYVSAFLAPRIEARGPYPGLGPSMSCSGG